MISIFKKKPVPERPDLSGIVADMHSHVLPGIDDGSPKLETSLTLVEGLKELGYQKLIATPHILWDIFKNDDSTIGAAYKQLKTGLKETGSGIKLQYAAEYFLDYHVDELIEEETPLLTVKDNWVLVEISFVSAPLDLKDRLFALQMAGYQPILAHPERYTYFANDRKIYDELFAAGFYLQVNLLSLAGYYGKVAQELGQYLVDKKYVRFLGTDLHHTRHLQTLYSATHLTDTVKFLQDADLLLNPQL